MLNALTTRPNVKSKALQCLTAISQHSRSCWSLPHHVLHVTTHCDKSVAGHPLWLVLTCRHRTATHCGDRRCCHVSSSMALSTSFWGSCSLSPAQRCKSAALLFASADFALLGVIPFNVISNFSASSSNCLRYQGLRVCENSAISVCGPPINL